MRSSFQYHCVVESLISSDLLRMELGISSMEFEIIWF
jgi:hypothetical protein